MAVKGPVWLPPLKFNGGGRGGEGGGEVGEEDIEGDVEIAVPEVPIGDPMLGGPEIIISVEGDDDNGDDKVTGELLLLLLVVVVVDEATISDGEFAEDDVDPTPGVDDADAELLDVPMPK